jgi:hypothetical protein
VKNSGDPGLGIYTVTPMSKDFKVQRLSDEFGQYLLVIKCAGCAHERRAYPNLLAHICGWDAKLADLEKRLRCSKCGKKSCRVGAIEMQKPRGMPPAH